MDAEPGQTLDQPMAQDTGAEPGEPRAGHRGRRRWISVVAGIAVVALGVVLAVVFVEDGDDEPTSQAPSTTVAPTTGAPATTGDDASAPAPTEAPPPAEAPVLEDGRYAAYLTGLDVGARTIEVDVIQFLTGDEAIAAYLEDNPDDPGGPPNDYYIVNDNPRLRELPVGGGVAITMLDWDGGFAPMTVAFEDMPAHLAADPILDDARLWPNPLWVTVEGGTVTAVEEQYTP